MSSAVSRFGTFFLAALAGGIVVWWLGGGTPAPEAPVAVAQANAFFTMRDQVVAVSQMPAAERVRLGGHVEPRHSVRLTAQAPGRVTYVAGQEGERLQAGQVAVALDDSGLQPEYRAAWATLSAEMARSQNAQTQLYHDLYGNRTSPLGGPLYDAYDRSSVPLYNMAQSFFGQMLPGLTGSPTTPFGSSSPMLTQQQAQKDWPVVNAARMAYEGQIAALAGAQAHIDMLDARLRDLRAVAPAQAAIMQRYVRVGDIVQPGQPLMDLADVDQLDLRIEVPLEQVANLRVGEQVPVTLGAVNLWAPVSQIFPGASDGQRTVTVRLALPADAPAAPGMFAVAWVTQPGGGSPSALAPAIPNSAIARRGSLPVAFAVDGRGTVEMRVLRLGEVQGPNTAVLSGLQTGESVVANPSADLKSGDSLAGSNR
ncbi:efflux RND transporter periplasmic adaptor subunit [Rhodobacter ferrooxidans]|uniref:Efflux transporter, RND family, MFP subunit n=1 Tax=Rhodobacter ferrooxidans TaxID=371731 RepID=C8S1C2_9RHOB|nr:efflux RND transporter periplasmic adaptor subunit [Rhodobacter sp. SW2]EEW25320.1 efflux transporter, RND family, MFP subunit [Rhodobacter sp. SW2]